MRVRAVAFIAFSALASCGDSVSVTDLVGLYEATEFTVLENGVTTDWLAEGATAQVILSANQTSAGTLFIPGGNTDGSDLTADLSGTWTIDGGKVLFDQPADTFFNDMAFTVAGNTLVGDQTFGSARVRITLTRTD